jgi:hypothetical protein
LHWDRLSRGESGLPAAAFIKQVLALPAGILFRHCVAGDQWPDPADPLRIDQALLLQLARATRHLRAAWSFTHFPMGPENQAAVRLAAAKGLVVNASTESRSVAAALVLQGLPAVCESALLGFDQWQDLIAYIPGISGKEAKEFLAGDRTSYGTRINHDQDLFWDLK